MKLQNQSLKYLSLSIFLIISIWAPIFYYNIQDEIHDSLDVGLQNNKIHLIQTLAGDSVLEDQKQFEKGNYLLKQISKSEAFSTFDRLTDTTIYMPASKTMEPVRMLSTAFESNNQKYYELKVITSLVEEDDLIADLLTAMVWLYIVLIVSIIIINNFVLKKLWRPFYQLLGDFKQYRIEKNEPLPPLKSKTEEFVDLKKAADLLTKHSQEGFLSQKQFTENAAHELQTPLAIITNKLELLLEKDNLKEDQAAELTQMLFTINRMKQLNKSLLLLSKIENKQFNENKPIQLAELCHQTLEELQPYAQYKHIQISFEGQRSTPLEMNPILAHILLSNLVKNAIFHNKPGGTVHIQLSEDTLSIANTASGAGLNKAEIFKRFYKNGDSQKNTGLGLSIVHAICKAYGFEVQYHFLSDQHVFEIQFPNKLS